MIATTATAEKIAEWRKSIQLFAWDCFEFKPDRWQEQVFDHWDRGEQRIAMQACKGPGKAQPSDTIIETPDGPRRMGDIAVGDRVFAGDGSATEVTGVFPRGVLPVYRVAFDDGSSTLACAEHLWKVRGRTERRHDRWTVLSTEQIVARGVREKNGQWAGRHFEIPRQGAAQFPEAHLPIDAYFLGVWLGDGVRLKSCYASKPSDEIAIELKRRGLRVGEPKLGLVTVYGQGAALRQLGVGGLYSFQRRIPSIAMRGSEAQRRDLLCGLMDTDGSIGTDAHMEYSTTSKGLAEDIVWLARSLGGVAFIKPSIKKPFYYDADRERIAGRDCYRVTIVTPFNPFRVAHRKSRWRDPMRAPSSARYLTRKIDAIDPAGAADCVCIAVAHPDHLYLTNDFIVTHNTAVIAILIWHFLATRPYANVAATSITADNLADCLWTELARWHQKSPLLLRAFEWTKTRITCRDHPETWWASARTWSHSANADTQGQTLAGLHANHMLFVLDETGGMPEAILVAAEAALASGIEVRIVQAGNPIQCEGPLWVAAGRDRRLWKIIEITGDPDDPNRSPRIDPTWAAEQIKSHGRENPWVMANVLGKFPSASPLSFIPSGLVEQAVKREATANLSDPLLIGVDPARFGNDKTVIRFRKGRDARTHAPIKLRNLDNMQVASRVAALARDMQADAVFVDGGGNGGGVIDALRAMHVPHVYEVNFGGAPDNLVVSGETARFANKGAEMYGLLREWLKGGAIDDDPELRTDLTTRRYAYKIVSGRECIILEPKDAMKQRGLSSPDDGDALALTFALPIQPHATAGFHGAAVIRGAGHQALTDYDPFAWAEDRAPARAQVDWDPFRNPPPD